MRLSRILILGMALSICTHSLSAQAPPPSSKATPAPQVQSQPPSRSQAAPPPFMPLFKKTVALVRTGFVDQKNGLPTEMIASGTAFFVAYPDSRIGAKEGFIYLVTNRHVVEPGIEDGHPHQPAWMTLRVNRKAGDSQNDVLPLSKTLHWFFPSDSSVDLAVLPLVPDQSMYDYVTIPLSDFATRQVMKEQGVTEGDSVLFAGYFYQFPGVKEFEPIVREGIIAMLPDEEMQTTLGKPGTVYLADLHVFGGNSGSPLVVNLGGLRDGRVMLGYDYMLLGVISGYYREDANFNLTVSTTLAGTLEENSGIAMVVPAEDLRALLDNPELKALRDAAAAAVSKKP